MQMRERDGVRAIVDIQPKSNVACRLTMKVEHHGEPVWSSRRDVWIADSDCAAVERTAIEAASAIADHLIRRRRLTR